MITETFALKDICLKITDGSHFSPKDQDEGFVMLSSKDMLENGFDYSDVKYISEIDYRKLVNGDCKPLKNDILIIKDGNSYLKRIFLCKEEREQVVLSSIAIVRPNTQLVDPEYLTYFLKSNKVKDEMAIFLSGAAIPRIILDDFKKVKIALPIRPIQRRIADILGRYDALIANYQQQISALEGMAQELYREWFVRGRYPHAEPGEESNIKLGSLVTTQYGFTASATEEDTGIKFLRITDISGSSLDWSTVPFCEIDEKEVAKYKLKTGDIVIARIGATAGYAKRIHKNHPEAVFASYLVRMQVINPIYDYYLGMSVESQDFKDFINRTVGGAAQPQANVPVLIDYELRLPSDEVLTKFNKIVEAIYDKIENLQTQLTTLRQTRDALLPRLLSGQLAVGDGEIVGSATGQNVAEVANVEWTV